MTNGTSSTQSNESRPPHELLPTKIEGVFTIPAPPGDFDPLSAGDGELVSYGFPPRPRGHTAREAVWERMVSARNRIIPDMDVQVGVTHNLRGLRPIPDTSHYLNNRWAGSVVRGNFSGNAEGVWHVPTVRVPGEPQGTEGGWNSASWIGIDGTFGSTDVLQAGVEQRVDAAGNATYIPWYAWYTRPRPDSPKYIYQVNITTVSVVPGQQVYTSVGYINNHTRGYIWFSTDAPSASFSIVLDPPPGASFSGNCAEWIMEAPDGGEPISSLPRFTPVTFTTALAFDAAGHATAAGTDATFNITGFNTTLTAVSSDQPGDVTISYIGP